MRNINITQSPRPKNSANSIGGLPQILSSVRSWPSECWQWLWLVPILQDDPTQRGGLNGVDLPWLQPQEGE